MGLLESLRTMEFYLLACCGFASATPRVALGVGGARDPLRRTQGLGGGRSESLAGACRLPWTPKARPACAAALVRAPGMWMDLGLSCGGRSRGGGSPPPRAQTGGRGRGVAPGWGAGQTRGWVAPGRLCFPSGAFFIHVIRGLATAPMVDVPLLVSVFRSLPLPLPTPLSVAHPPEGCIGV